MAKIGKKTHPIWIFILLFLLYDAVHFLAFKIVDYQNLFSIIIFLLLILSLSAILLVWHRKIAGNRSYSIKDIYPKIWICTILLCTSLFLTTIVFFGFPTGVVNKTDITLDFFVKGTQVIFGSAIVEEILFRGILQKYLNKKFNPTKAILITTIIFAAVHYRNLNNILPAIFIGAYCGIIFYKTEKLIICIFFHCLFNLIAGIFIFNGNYVLLLQFFAFVISLAMATYSIRELIKIDSLK